MAQNCTFEGKRISQQKYAHPDVSIKEIKNPGTVIREIINKDGYIIEPVPTSPLAEFKDCKSWIEFKEQTVEEMKAGIGEHP